MSRVMILAAVAMLGACGTVRAENAGPSGSRSFGVQGFDRVSLRGSDNVVVKVGAAESVNATGPQNILDKLKVEVVDGELRVGREKSAWNISWGDHDPVVITVTLPRIRGASVAGSGDMKVDTVQIASFSGSVAGSGNLSVGSLQADSASFDIAGSGDASVAGAAKSVDISIAGSGDLDAKGLKADRAKISIAGSGDVSAQVTGDADVSIVGSGDVVLSGHPRCKISKMGSGEVTCG